MQYTQLGSAPIQVSRVCLGSMTWGVQNNQQQAAQQIEYALAQGVNFIDTAEMYAIPPTPETYGTTEAIIGNWLAAHPKRRADIVLATKIAGNGLSWIRNGGAITGEAIIASVDASLARLQTDYIDLYQLHWPNRTSPHFAKHWPGQLQFTTVDAKQQTDDMLTILHALDDCVKAGKIRYCGLSDDTPWGINTYLKLAQQHALPQMVSIQNEFSLLHTKDWPYLIENCVHESVAYLPWSPLAGGALSGKYLHEPYPEGSRWSMSQRNGLIRNTPQAHAAISAYVALAHQYGITPSQLALAWCNHVDGVTSTIIGATSLAQLKEDIDAFSLQLTPEQRAEIGEIHRRFPMPF